MNIRPVSVIVCTYNRAAFLPNVISQLCAQDYPKDSFEIIVVDNRSSDDTPQTVQRFIPTKKRRGLRDTELSSAGGSDTYR